MKKFIQSITTMFALCALLIVPKAYAGTETHGGDGVYLNGNLYLLDLVEEGVQSSPYVEDLEPLEGLEEKLEKQFKRLDDVPTRMVAQKITELFKHSHSLGLRFVYGIMSHRWISVDHVLVDVPDEDSVLDFQNLELEQLAIRRASAIRISSQSWSKLDDFNKAALIVHEIAYFLADNSPAARDFTGVVFAEPISDVSSLVLFQLSEKNLKVMPTDYVAYYNLETLEFHGGVSVRFVEYEGTEKIASEEISLHNGMSFEENISVSRVRAWEYCSSLVNKDSSKTGVHRMVGIELGFVDSYQMNVARSFRFQQSGHMTSDRVRGYHSNYSLKPGVEHSVEACQKKLEEALFESMSYLRAHFNGFKPTR